LSRWGGVTVHPCTMAVGIVYPRWVEVIRSER
jgi:hypothetical protein